MNFTRTNDNYLIDIPNTKCMSSCAGLAIILANTGREKESVIFMLLDAFNKIEVTLKPLSVPSVVFCQGVNPIEIPISTPFTEKGYANST